MCGLLLIVGPVGVLATPLVTWVGDKGVGERNPHMRSKLPCRHAKHTSIRKVGQKRGNLRKNSPSAVQPLVGATDAVCGGHFLRFGMDRAHFVCGDDSLEHRPTVNL